MCVSVGAWVWVFFLRGARFILKMLVKIKYTIIIISLTLLGFSDEPLDDGLPYTILSYANGQEGNSMHLTQMRSDS
jgi:hypothetical protein